jgi:hypothetical protein
MTTQSPPTRTRLPEPTEFPCTLHKGMRSKHPEVMLMTIKGVIMYTWKCSVCHFFHSVPATDQH